MTSLLGCVVLTILISPLTPSTLRNRWMPTSYINLQIKGDIIHISQQNVVFILHLSSCQFQTYNFCPSFVPMTQYLLITNLKKKLELKQKSQLSIAMLSPSNEIHFIPRKTGSCLNRGEGYSITFGLMGGGSCIALACYE